ncbi:MAG: ABC transporter substrate-binding protein [Pikeienuella sp.]
MIRRPLLTLATAAAIAFATRSARAETPADTLIEAQAIDGVISFDPAEIFEFLAGEVSNNIYLRLITLEEEDTTKLVGGAAESWTVSDDGLTLTFTMRPDLKFASGAPVTAKDAAFSLQRVVKLNLSPAFILTLLGWSTENVDQMVVAKDDATLELKIAEPLAPTLVLNALSAGVGAVVEESVVMANEKDGDLGHEWLSRNSAGAGAFVLRDWRPNEVIVLEANKNFYKGAPTLERIIIRHVPEAATQRLMLEKGDIDIARNLGSDQLEALSSNPDVKIDIQPKANVLYLGMNTTLDVLADAKVREAIRWLVDYQGIADALLQRQYIAHQSVLGSGGFAALDDLPYSFDPEKAKALLAEAGQSDLKLTLDVFAASPFRDIAETLQANFAQAGVELEIVAADRKQTLTKYRARNHQLVMMYWSPDYGDPHSTIDFFVNNPDNTDQSTLKTIAWRNGWASAETQKLMKDAMLEGDPAKREEMYARIQRTLQHESPVAVMFQQTDAVAMRANVNGWISGPSFDTYVFRNITK